MFRAANGLSALIDHVAVFAMIVAEPDGAIWS
jgi:hypothetical protein